MEYTDEIYEKAVELLGGSVSDGKVAALRSMCEAAGAELLARLRSGVSAEEIKASFVMAAGVLALSMYTQLSGDEEVSSFSAGNLSVSKSKSSGGGSSASALRAQAETMLASYLTGHGFEFLGVRG